MAGELSSEEYQRCLEILELEEGANLEEIKSAYRTKAKSCHPDKNPNDPCATEKFQDLHWAMKTLIESIGNQNDVFEDDIIHYVEVDELLYFILREYIMERMFHKRHMYAENEHSNRRDGCKKNSGSDNRFSKHNARHEDNDNALVKSSAFLISVPDEKYALVEKNDYLQEDKELLNVLRKKYQNEYKEDDIEEEVKKFTSFHEWEKAEKEKIKKKQKNKTEIMQQKPKYQSKKDQEHLNYRRQKEGEKIQEELLLKLKEEEEKLKRRLQKEAEKRRQVEKQKYDSLIEHASYELVKDTKPKDDGKRYRKIGSARLKQDSRTQHQLSVHGIQEATSKTLSAKSEHHSDSLDDIWEENWNSVKSSTAVPSAAELWDDDTEKKNKNIRYQEKNYYIKKLQEKEHGRNSKEREELHAAENKKSRKGRNQSFSNKDSSQSFKDNKRSNQCKQQKGNQTFTKNVSPYFHADSEERSLKDESWDKPWIKEAPPPDINIWEQRQSQIETLKDLQPYSTEDEETMLQRAIELSKLQVIEDEKRRRKLQAAYEVQLQYLSKNTELLENDNILPENVKKSENLSVDWPASDDKGNTEKICTKLDVNQETSDELDSKSNALEYHGGARPKVKHIVNSSEDCGMIDENFYNHDKLIPKLERERDFDIKPSKQSECWDNYLIDETASSHDSILYNEKREEQNFSGDFELKSEMNAEKVFCDTENYTDAEYAGTESQEDYWDNDLMDVPLLENIENREVYENSEYDLSEKELKVQLNDESEKSEHSYDRDLSITNSNNMANETPIASSELDFKKPEMNDHDFSVVLDEKEIINEACVSDTDEDIHDFNCFLNKNKVPGETHIPVAENLTRDYAFVSRPSEVTPVEESTLLNGEYHLNYCIPNLPPENNDYLKQPFNTIKENACDDITTPSVTESIPQNRQPVRAESSYFTSANDVNLGSQSASSFIQETMKLKDQIPNTEFGLGTGFPFLPNPAVAGISPFGPIDPSFLLSSGLPMNSPMNPQLLWLMYSNPFFIQQLQALQVYYAALGAASTSNLIGQSGEVPKFNIMGQPVATELSQLTADMAHLSAKNASTSFSPTAQSFIGSENLFTNQPNVIPSFASQLYPPFNVEETKQKVCTEPPGINVNLFRPYCSENSQVENSMWKDGENFHLNAISVCDPVPSTISANVIGIPPPKPPNFQQNNQKSSISNSIIKQNSKERECINITNTPHQIKSLQPVNCNNDCDYNGLGHKENTIYEQHSSKAMWTNLENTESTELLIASQKETVYNHNNDPNRQLPKNETSVNSKNEYSDHNTFGKVSKNKETALCQQIHQPKEQDEACSQYTSTVEENEEEPIPWGNSEDELINTSVKESYDKWSDTDDESETVGKKYYSIASGSDIWDDDTSRNTLTDNNKYNSSMSSLSQYKDTAGGGDSLNKNKNQHGKNKGSNSPQGCGDHDKAGNGVTKMSASAHRMNINYQNKNQRYYHSEKSSPLEDMNSMSHNSYIRSRGGPRAEKLQGSKPKYSGTSSTSFKQRERSRQNSSC